MTPTSPIKNVAIMGATGNMGRFFVEALLKTGKHTVTALTRAESKGVLPDGVQRVPINQDDPDSLVTALKGQEFLIIAVGVSDALSVQSKICKAAADAGVRYVMPSLFGFDVRDPKLAGEPHGQAILKSLSEIESLGLSYITLGCGVWYEWSLALGEQWFGFQIKERKVTFIDDGKTPLITSTWLQCGRAVAALLSLPESGASPSLSDWKNEQLNISSFRVSQRDMLDSLHHVLSTKDEDWEITYETAEKRVADGLEEVSKGRMKGFAKSSYGKHFIRHKELAYEPPRAESNEVLGLPTESLDEATKRAIEMVESGWNPLPKNWN
ncbi:NAD(P)-binding protein [Thozetella sp. PMI_491]|nr:NAD(P)-binding protein [Thozetella sp. PMI_491]